MFKGFGAALQDPGAVLLVSKSFQCLFTGLLGCGRRREASENCATQVFFAQNVPRQLQPFCMVGWAYTAPCP